MRGYRQRHAVVSALRTDSYLPLLQVTPALRRGAGGEGMGRGGLSGSGCMAWTFIRENCQGALVTHT